MLSTFRIRYYRLSKTSDIDFQNSVLPDFRIRCYRISEFGVTHFHSWECQLQTYLVYNLYFFKDKMVFTIKLGGAG